MESWGRDREKKLWVTVVSDRRGGLCLVSFAAFPSSKGGGFSSGSAAKNLPVMRETGFDPWVGNIPWRNGNPLQYSCLGRGRSGGLVFPSLSEFSTVYCDPHKGFGIVNEAEIDVFLELACFFDDPVDIGNLISDSSAFSKTSLNIWKFTVHVLLKPGLENFEHYFTSM